MSIDRREFLKRSAASAAAAVIGVDLLFGDEAFAGNGMEWHKSVCRFCGVGCGVMVGVKDGTVAGIKGDTENTINRGLLCVKGFYLHKIVNADGRLLHPMVRKNGELVQVSWDEAMDLVASKFQESIEKKGPDAVAFYGSGQAETEETYIANRLFKGHIGTNNFEGNPRLCMASAVGGYLTTFGADEPVGSYDDLDHADLFFLIGSNTAECHPVLYDRLVDRKTKNPHVKIVSIDPRKTPTDKIIDLHLQVKPGYDLAIMNAVAHVLVKEGMIDEEFIGDSVNFSNGKEPISFDDYKVFLEKYTPEYAAEQCGVSPEEIIEVARLYGETPRVVSLWTMGVNQRVAGVWLNNLIHNLHLLTGKIGVPGSDSLSLTGQPNACGGVREGGGLCHILPGHRKVASEQHREEIAEIWNVDPSVIQPKPGKHTVAMFDALNTEEIECIYVMCTNPAQSLPNLNRYLPGMEKAFMVVAESFYPTATTEYADVVLPAAFWAEKEGVYGCTERRSQYMPQVVEPRGEARWDGWILKDLAERLGFGDNFAKFEKPQDVWDEYRLCTKGRDVDLMGAPYERLKKVRGLRWPVPTVDDPGTVHRFTDNDPLFPKDKAAGRRMYFYGKPDGKAVVFARPDKGPEEPTDAEYPVAMTTGRVLEHYHTSTMTGQVAELRRAVPKPYVEIHPDDAAAWGIAERDPVKIVTRRDELVLDAVIVDRPRPGTIFIPWHWAESLANLLTTDAIDPGSKEPEYKVCAARVMKA